MLINKEKTKKNRNVLHGSNLDDSKVYIHYYSIQSNFARRAAVAAFQEFLCFCSCPAAPSTEQLSIYILTRRRRRQGVLLRHCGLLPRSSTKGRRARGSSCLRLLLLPRRCAAAPAIHRRHDVVAVAVVVASDRAHRRGVAVPPPSRGAAHGGAVVAAAPAGAPLRAPRRARAGLPLLLRQLHRAHPPHGGRLLPPRAAPSAARRPPQGARLLPPLEEALR